MSTDLIQTIQAAWDEHLEATKQRSGGEPYRPRNTYASGRRDCVRWMALDLTNPEDNMRPFPVDALERFTMGDEGEEAVTTRLRAVAKFVPDGMKIIGEQRRFEIGGSEGRGAVLSGRLDFSVETGGTKASGRREEVAGEIKSGATVQRVYVLDDFENSVWTRHYPDQLLSYMLGTSTERGLFILRKWMGRPQFIMLNLEDHLDRAEAFLKEAEQAYDCLHQDADLPDYCEDTTVCRRCPHFGKACAPPTVSFGDGLKLLDDPGFIEQVDWLLEIAPLAREHKKLAATIKDKLVAMVEAGNTDTKFVVGDALARVKVYEKKAEKKPRAGYSYSRVFWDTIKDEGGAV